jgi:anaphase-promoting complex subunit 4
MLPALDRCAVILSRFAGIAKFQGSNETAGFSNQQIQQIMDVVASLHLVSSKILIQVVDELDSFIAFSAWLRYEIDRLASDSSISMTDEAVEKEASIDHSKVLSYLQTAMVNSPLSVFFGADADADREGQCQIQSGSSIFDQVNRQLQKHEQGVPYIEALPRVTFLCRLLSLQANAVFSQIAETEKQNVLFGKAHELGVPEGSSPMDMAMCPAVCIASHLL